MINKGIQGIFVIILAIFLLAILFLALFPIEFFVLVLSIFLIYYFRKHENKVQKPFEMDQNKISIIDNMLTSKYITIFSSITILIAISSVIISFETVLNSF